MRDAPSEYLEHLQKKVKNLLIRVALMYNIRDRIKPHPEMHMPILAGGSPAGWWGPDQDRDLLIGICRHGYQQYSKIWRDPDLSFYKIIPQAPDSGIAKVEGKEEGGDDDHETLDDVVMEQDELEESGQENAIKPDSVAPTAALDGSIYVPSPTELGLRIRKITGGLARHMGKTHELSEKERKEKHQEKRRGKEDDMSKKARQDFQRAILIYGVERNGSGDAIQEWDKFKDISSLTRKSDKAMTVYLEKLIILCNETIKFNEKTKGTTEGVDKLGIPVGDEGESITLDRAKKVLRRIEYFDKLRLEVLPMPDVTFCLTI